MEGVQIECFHGGFYLPAEIYERVFEEIGFKGFSWVPCSLDESMSAEEAEKRKLNFYLANPISIGFTAYLEE